MQNTVTSLKFGYNSFLEKVQVSKEHFDLSSSLSIKGIYVCLQR